MNALIAQELIHIMGHEDHWLRVCRGLDLAEVRASRGPTVDTTIAALEIAASGTGCALAHRLHVASYLATGRLVPALDREFADGNSYFVVTPERPRRISREVQVFRDWLVALRRGQEAL